MFDDSFLLFLFLAIMDSNQNNIQKGDNMNIKDIKEKIVDVISNKLNNDISTHELLRLAQTVSELEKNEMLKETLGKGIGFGSGNFQVEENKE